jgi:uncharacterized protein
VAPRTGRGATKSIFDPVHGPIRLEGVALELVSTAAFQRLWGIRQTGFAHLVFPGANHTRLEHSLGTYWVAARCAERLKLPGPAARRVSAGALLHDLGHGPFSHTLDAPMREVLGYGHERLSRARILGTEDLPGIEATEVPRVLERHGLVPREVADLVDPPRGDVRPPILREILHGPIDADRLDYLQRDAHYTGVAHGAVDAVRLLDTLRARDGHLVFAEKGRGAVEGFLVGRSLMYATVYFHHTVRAAEAMAQAAFERRPGFPDDARAWFPLTDGDFLAALREGHGPSAGLAEALRTRRLHKRALVVRTVPRGSRWHRLLRAPAERRALEDALADRFRGRPGEVLLDLSGLEPRRDPSDDWGRVALVEDEAVTYPFRGTGPWRSLVDRPVSDAAISVFAAPRVRESVARGLDRDPSLLP